MDRRIKDMLEKERVELKKIVRETKRRLINAPKGNLRISKRVNGVEYYYCDENSKSGGRFIKRNERELVNHIAQRDYDIKVLRRAEERIRDIDRFLKKYDKTCLKKLYEQTNSYRRVLISPVEISDEEYIKNWQKMPYEGKGFTDGMPEILTEQGERVRSKSEKIIADKLYLLGIPYKYESPLLLDEHTVVYPDFTILDMRTRKELYLEHFGMMDDSEYVKKTLFKLDTYERNGIFLGVNLFMTHETGRNPLNVRNLDKFLKMICCS